MSNIPSVVIVGRMNVGKSTLFNKLSAQEKSIAYDYAGVTRDFMTDIVSWQGKKFSLIDTGGIGVHRYADPMQEQVRQRAFAVMQEAAVIVFVCDGQTGPTLEDEEIAKHLHRTNRPVLLVVNKIDSNDLAAQEFSFTSLGFADTLPLSAEHGRGIAELLERIVHMLPDQSAAFAEDEAKASVVLLGKPNVGKSSLMNALLKSERMIVSPVAGTTREAVKEKIRFYQETIELVDTPGIRRKRSVEEPLEQLMVKSSLRAVKQADIVLLMLDSTAGEISDQELKLAFYVFEQGKGLILLYNKSDIVTDEHKASFESQAPLYRQLLHKVPKLAISCLTKKNIGKIIPLVDEVFKRYCQRFDNQELLFMCKEWLQKTPLHVSNTRLIVHDAQQVSTRPITIALYVNIPQFFGPTQCAFFENKMRAQYDLTGVPVHFVIRKASE